VDRELFPVGSMSAQPSLHEIAARRREEQPARPAELVNLIRIELREGVEHAVRAGALLIDAKRVVDHGNWLPWLRENFGLSERSAQNFMKLSRDMATLPAANAKRVALLPLREALASIAKSRLPELRTNRHPVDGKPTQTATPKPTAKITRRAPTVTSKAPTDRGHGDVDHAGDDGPGGPDHGAGEDHGDEQGVQQPGGDDIQQPDHAGDEHHVGHGAGAGAVQRHGSEGATTMQIADIKIMPPGYWRDRADVQPQVLAQLLDAWDEASDETRREFLLKVYDSGLLLSLMTEPARAIRKGAA